MAKDRIFFLLSFAFLGLVAAFSFGNKKNPEPPSAVQADAAEALKPPSEEKQEVEILEVAQGKIAIPLQLTTRAAVINFVHPGDLIDIIFTSKSDVGIGTISVTLLNNIRILAIGRDSEGKFFFEKASFYRPNTPIEILIEVTQKQAEILSYAEAAGSITIGINENGDVEPEQKYAENSLLGKLMMADSDVNFNSVLVTHMITSLFPELDVKITATAKGYIASGTIQDQQTSDKVIQVLGLLAADGKKSVVNLMEEGNPIVQVLVAKKDLKAGAPLLQSDYQWVKIDKSAANPSLIVRSVQTDEWLQNAKIAQNIHQNGKIHSKDLSWGHQEDETEGLAANTIKLTPGKRAVPVRLGTRSLIIQFIQPGLLVDVKFTSRPEIGFDPVSLVLLRNIRVLSICNDENEKSRMDKPFDGSERFYQPNGMIEVFLEMTPEEAEAFAYAEISGIIFLELAGVDSDTSNDLLVDRLLHSHSLGDFHSALVTYMLGNLFPLVDINVISTPKGYIIEGKVPDPQMAMKIMEIMVKLVPGGERAVIDMMDVEPQQVLLCVKVVEVSKEIISRIGINWQVLLQTATQSLAFGAVYPANPVSDPNFFIKGKGVTGTTHLSAIIEMLEEDGLAKVLAEPNLTTISGVKANFFAGGEFPILIPQGGALLGTVTVEYKKYGVILEFTPEVEQNGLICLHVVPEVSNIDKENAVILSGFVIPSLISRKVDTIVKLWPGQSYLIAGLYLDELTNINDNLYGLNKIPLIGSFFGSNRTRDRRTELLVMVTPYLINNANGYPCPPIPAQRRDGTECALEEPMPGDMPSCSSMNPPVSELPFVETPWET